MPHYRCVLTDARGATEKRVVFASDKNELIRKFREASLTVLSIEETAGDTQTRRTRKKAQEAVLDFTKMMELLVESGLSLRDGLEIANSIGQNTGAGILAKRILDSVGKGLSFAQAIESERQLFSPIYRGMIRVGDKIGSVERIFPRLASYLSDRKALKDKVSGALVYPLMVLFVTIFGGIGLLIFVLPKMQTIFEGFGGTAGAQIQGNIVRMRIGFAVLLGILASFVATIVFLRYAKKRNEDMSLRIDRAILTIPIIGKYLMSWETLNFAFAMETLLSGNVPLELAIEEAATVVSNSAYRAALLQVKADVLKGSPVSSAFATHAEFPPYMVQWLVIGERSGNTEKVFSQIRTYFQSEVEQITGKATTLIEPALILIVGVLVLALVTGIVVPLFGMYGSIL